MFGAHVTPETELIWEDLVQKHPKCLPFKNKGWQFWPKMKEIMGSPPPQGLRVFHTGQNSSAEQHERSQSLPWDIEQDGVPLPDDSQVCIYSFFIHFLIIVLESSFRDRFYTGVLHIWYMDKLIRFICFL